MDGMNPVSPVNGKKLRADAGNGLLYILQRFMDLQLNGTADLLSGKRSRPKRDP